MNDTDNKQLYLDFEAYERVAEPHKRERASAWRTAIGLQDVDGLKVSDYLKETAVRHIEGDITIDDVREQLKSYTRTTAVFVIKYLRSIGFKVDNDLFANNSWYFRNALVRANYRNPSKGIEPNKSFLVMFFRNLMLGEHNELKNRYMLIGYIDSDTPPTSTPTSTPTSIEPMSDALSDTIKRLIVVIGQAERSVKEMMDAIGLKDRKNFLEYSLTPAISDGLVRMKYPNSPRHPRQKYLLTVKGLTMYDECKKQLLK